MHKRREQRHTPIKRSLISQNEYPPKRTQVRPKSQFLLTRSQHISLTVTKPSGFLAQAKFHLYTIWLFTESNIPTFVFPNTAFGILSALAGAQLLSSEAPPAIQILLRVPLVILFNWTNVFIFDLSNQRFPDSIAEDKLNKPWRPICIGRITPNETRQLALVSIPLVLAFNAALGVWRETALLLILTWLYNDLRGGDELSRDFIIATAFAIYNHGSLRIAAGSTAEISTNGYLWIGVISATILMTMQVQDLKDMKGDSSRGRKTWPLVLGSVASRWIIAVSILGWALLCMWFWDAGFIGVGPLGLGGYVAWRALYLKEPGQDGTTWRLWCLWTALLYAMPAGLQLHTLNFLY